MLPDLTTPEIAAIAAWFAMAIPAVFLAIAGGVLLADLLLGREDRPV
jgi:hypothetical protein